MPFTKAQSALKAVLPKLWFDSLYNVACNTLDVYQDIATRIFCVKTYILARLTRNYDLARKMETVQTVLSHTMVSKLGVIATYDTANEAKGLSGSFVECGVARGGCSAVLALVAQHEGKDRKTWMFDSFEGLPPQTEEDGIQKPIRHKNRRASDLTEGYCLGTLEEVDGWFFSHLRLSRDNVFMVKGWFHDTLPVYRGKIGDIAVLRLDGDWYESTKCCLENLYGNVVSDGYIIIDDYQLQGCKKAVDEFLASIEPMPEVVFDSKGRRHLRKI